MTDLTYAAEHMPDVLPDLIFGLLAAARAWDPWTEPSPEQLITELFELTTLEQANETDRAEASVLLARLLKLN